MEPGQSLQGSGCVARQQGPGFSRLERNQALDISGLRKPSPNQDDGLSARYPVAGLACDGEGRGSKTATDAPSEVYAVSLRFEPSGHKEAAIFAETLHGSDLLTLSRCA